MSGAELFLQPGSRGDQSVESVPKNGLELHWSFGKLERQLLAHISRVNQLPLRFFQSVLRVADRSVRSHRRILNADSRTAHR